MNVSSINTKRFYFSPQKKQATTINKSKTETLKTSSPNVYRNLSFCANLPFKKIKDVAAQEFKKLRFEFINEIWKHQTSDEGKKIRKKIGYAKVKDLARKGKIDKSIKAYIKLMPKEIEIAETSLIDRQAGKQVKAIVKERNFNNSPLGKLPEYLDTSAYRIYANNEPVGFMHVNSNPATKKFGYGPDKENKNFLEVNLIGAPGSNKYKGIGSELLKIAKQKAPEGRVQLIADPAIEFAIAQDTRAYPEFYHSPQTKEKSKEFINKLLSLAGKNPHPGKFYLKQELEPVSKTQASEIKRRLLSNENDPNIEGGILFYLPQKLKGKK